MAKVTAVIDIGSNSARIAIYRRTSRFGFYLLREEKSRIRISEGAYLNNGNLQEFAIERALKALREFLLIAKSHKARKILAVATSAVRDAPNRSYFLSRVKRELGLQIKVIDGTREAELDGIAVANLLYKKDGIGVDIGGGSTEVTLIQNRRVVKAISLKLGTVRLKELFFERGDIEGAKEYIKEEFKKLKGEYHHKTIFGIGGSIRAFSKLLMEKNEYPLDILHGYTYKVEDELEFMEEVIYASDKKLLKLGVKPDRVDTIREGILIFRLLLDELRGEEVITSGVGVREGVFLRDLLRNSGYRFPGNFNPSVRTIIDIYNIDTSLASYEIKIANRLFDLLKDEWELKEKYRSHLAYALKLSRAGNLIDFYESHKHTDYILLNSLNYGFSHQDRLLISKIIRFHKKREIKKKEIEKFKKLLPSRETLQKLCFIFWIARVVNINNSKPEVEIWKEGDKIKIKGKNLYLAKGEVQRKPHFYPVEIEDL
jgi:exopolyphosphatase/guanosine-5'-triphosphate,3'-diphosphate pyrophosphatase